MINMKNKIPLTARLEDLLYELHKACWNKGEGFKEEEFMQYQKTVRQLHEDGYDVNHHRGIVEAYKDAYRLWKDVQEELKNGR